MRRIHLSYCGSIALHAAFLGWLTTAVAALPTQLPFRRGLASIELQATVAAAPRAEPEPLPLELEPEPQPRSEKPLLVREPSPKPDRREAKLPELPRTELGVEPPPPTASEVAIERPVSPEPAAVAKVEPPRRTQSDAQPRELEAEIESPSLVASQADSGVEADQLPSPHPLNRQPAYPADAYSRRQQGTVLLRLTVDIDGRVDEVAVHRSSGFRSLDDAAVEAARQWRFTPARRGGKNVPILFETNVNFYFRS